jgi:hypothetical protein
MIRKHSILKLNLFPSSGVGTETRTLWGPLERVNLNQTQQTLILGATVNLHLILSGYIIGFG